MLIAPGRVGRVGTTTARIFTLVPATPFFGSPTQKWGDATVIFGKAV